MVRATTRLLFGGDAVSRLVSKMTAAGVGELQRLYYLANVRIVFLMHKRKIV